MYTVKLDQHTAVLAHQIKARMLYVIAEHGGMFVKVGITKDSASLARRLTNLQTGNPRKLSIVHTVTFTGDGMAYSVEQLTLNLYGTLGTRLGDSEWTSSSVHDIVSTINILVEGD